MRMKQGRAALLALGSLNSALGAAHGGGRQLRDDQEQVHVVLGEFLVRDFVEHLDDAQQTAVIQIDGDANHGAGVKPEGLIHLGIKTRIAAHIVDGLRLAVDFGWVGRPFARREAKTL